MKLLFDQNLSPKLATKLSLIFPGSAHVQDLSLDRSNDFDVWVEALKNNFTIVTKDIDYTDFVTIYGFPPKVIWRRRGNCKTEDIWDLLIHKIDLIEKFSSDNNDGILIIR